MDGTPENKNYNATRELMLASTPVDLAKLRLERVAYIRRTMIGETPVWSIHNAAGEQVGAALIREQAWGAVLQNDLTPLYVN